MSPLPTVTKRDGKKQILDEQKLRNRVNKLMNGLALETSERDGVDVDMIVKKTVDGAKEGMSTTALDTLAAESACYCATRHPDYSYLAGRLAVSALHKTTSGSFTKTVTTLYNYTNLSTGKHAPLVSEGLYKFVQEHGNELDKVIDYTRDYRFDYFGFKTLERSYLLWTDEGDNKRKTVERPQDLFMRCALGIWCSNGKASEDLPQALKTYDLMSQGYFTHASPTLFNSGTPRPQLSSCFLVAMKDDSIDGIFNTLTECAKISKTAGGIGFHLHNIRATGSYIQSTNGNSNGIVPMLRVFNDTARYVDQGGGKRKGSFAAYLEPWHADIFDFLNLRKNHGKEEQRARDLFYALWIPDLFMERVEADGDWSLMCPNEAKGLADVWGKEFETLYTTYEKEGRGRKKLKARELWNHILDSQIETGTPYMLYKDSANRKSNHQHLGTIKCSNLCTEIIEYTAPDETAVCNLASIALPNFVKYKSDGTPFYDFEELRSVASVAAKNLDRVIDINFYPVESARNSNMRHRPVGIGVQGLADTFMKMGYSFTCPEARRLNIDIFETIYFASMETSAAIAEQKGAYETFDGSPASKGILQFDMWGKTPQSGRWDWDALKVKIQKTGLRNSLMVAPMPTASTSQILGNNECFEPFTSNLYVRRVLSGEFPLMNKYLVKDLSAIGLWTNDIRQQIIAHNGSIQKIAGIPDTYKEKYKTVWEIKQKDLIDMMVDRAPYIDQSASLNVFLSGPTNNQLTSMHFYTWKQGLKTGMYYLRTQPAAEPIKFTVDAKYQQQQHTQVQDEAPVCTMEPGCVSCGS